MRRFLVIILSLLALCLVLASCEDTAPYVVGAGYDTDNNLILEYSDGSTLNLGKINQKGEQGEKGDKGDTGENGVGISKAEIVNGELVITYTDGTVQNLGKITQSEQNEENFTDGLDFYPLPDGTYGVAVGNAKYLDTIVIPETHEGKAVTQIVKNGFDSAENLKSIVLPSTLTTIGKEAFYHCNALTDIDFGGVEVIGDGAFHDCTSLATISLPSSVKIIVRWAFADCTSLKSVTISNGVTSINESVFRNCTALEEISLPSTINTIDFNAFYGCASLTSISIPDSLTSIDPSAFNNCTNLKYNEYDNALYLGNDQNPHVVLIRAKDTTITSCKISENAKVIFASAFGSCSKLKYNEYDNALYLGNDQDPYIVLIKAKDATITSCKISESAKVVCDYAFRGCSSLASITIPSRITSIGDSAFSGCKSITSITIPDGVTSISRYTFNGCSSLTSITIPSSVTSIGDYALEGCSSLTSITIPSSVTLIGHYAFRGCSKLTEITCEAQKKPTDWVSLWNYGCNAKVNWGYTGE